MFSDKQIETYKKISAPPELYDKIKSSSEKRSRFIPASVLRIAGAVAACLVLVSAVLLLMGRPSPEIICNGQVLEDSVLFYDISPASDMRVSPVFTVPFEFELTGDTEITVSYGRLVTPEGDEVDSTSFKGKTEIWWELPRKGEDLSCEMVLEDKNGTTRITLSYDDTEKTIRATKETK